MDSKESRKILEGGITMDSKESRKILEGSPIDLKESEFEIDGFDEFFRHGYLAKDKYDNLYFVARNATSSYFAIKIINDTSTTLTLKELEEIKIAKVITIFTYRNKFIVTSADDDRINTFKEVLIKHKDILLKGFELNS